jgi:hypothetical protein
VIRVFKSVFAYQLQRILHCAEQFTGRSYMVLFLAIPAAQNHHTRTKQRKEQSRNESSQA